MTRHKKQPRTFWDKFWRDEHGQDVIWQRPNRLLLIWLISAFIALLLRGGILEDTVQWIGIVALALWAIREIAWGVNYFWRYVGAMVLIIILFIKL